jgi:uncharacterized protein HemY
MDIQATKLELVQLILKTNTPALLEQVRRMLQVETKTDWWDNLPESVRQSIDLSLQEAEHEELIPHDDVMNEARAKYLNAK